MGKVSSTTTGQPPHNQNAHFIKSARRKDTSNNPTPTTHMQAPPTFLNAWCTSSTRYLSPKD
eukprot:c43460_g1_i1 orf=93-278(+)